MATQTSATMMKYLTLSPRSGAGHSSLCSAAVAP
jgi:hypothetical protein